MASIWDRVGTAIKAGAKGAADSILSPSSAPAQSVEFAPTGISTPTPAADWKKWIVPGAALGILGWAILSGSKPKGRR